MEIEICAVGGYENVGKNMTALRIDDEVVILDMGVNMEALVAQEAEEGNSKSLSPEQLINLNVLPDDRIIKNWKNKVKAIVLGHCHYDHVAAVRYLAPEYNCPVIGSPYTIELLKTLLQDDEVKIPNKLIKQELNSIIEISKNIKIELVSMSHSTLQCAVIVIHTPKGAFVYANDFKFDDDPILGEKPNYKRLKEIGEEGTIALVIESMYAEYEGKAPTEGEAREKLKEAIEEADKKNNAIFVTTFSSQFARLKSTIEFSHKIKRTPVIIGRSMAKYIEAAEKIKLVNFTKQAELAKYGSQRRRKLKEIEQNRGKYLVICTGGQGEPGSILDKIITTQLHFNFKEGDVIIFSNSVIPVATNIANREKLEKALETRKLKIYRNIHSSGHGRAEDLRYFIELVKPKYLLPSQGDSNMEQALANIAEKEGYKKGETIHQLHDGQKLMLEK